MAKLDIDFLVEQRRKQTEGESYEERLAKYRKYYEYSKNFESRANGTLTEILDNESNRRVAEYFKKNGTPQAAPQAANSGPKSDWREFLGRNERPDLLKTTADIKTKEYNALKNEPRAAAYERQAEEYRREADNAQNRLGGINYMRTGARSKQDYAADLKRTADRKRERAELYDEAAKKLRAGEEADIESSYFESWNQQISQTDAAREQAKQTGLQQFISKNAGERTNDIKLAKYNLQKWTDEKGRGHSSYPDSYIDAQIEKYTDEVESLTAADKAGRANDAARAKEEDIKKYEALTKDELKRLLEIAKNSRRAQEELQWREWDMGGTGMSYTDTIEYYDDRIDMLERALYNVDRRDKLGEYEKVRKEKDYKPIAAATAAGTSADKDVEACIDVIQSGNSDGEDARRWRGVNNVGNKAVFARKLKEEYERLYGQDEYAGVFGDVFNKLPELNSIEAYQWLTDEEYDTYNYLYVKKGEQAAEEYFALLEDDIDKRRREREKTDAVKYAKDKPVDATIVSIGTNLFGFAGIVGTVEESIANQFREVAKPLDADGQAYQNTAITQAIRGTVQEDMSDAGRFWYGVATSAADNITQTAVFGHTAAPIVMAGSAATSTYYDLAEQGISDYRAVAVSVMAGVFEFAFEHMGMERIFGALDDAMANYDGLWHYIKDSVLSEFMEEAGTEGANIITNALLLGKDSEWAQKLRELNAQGVSDGDAIRQVLKDYGLQIIEAGTAGLVTGAVLGGFNALETRIKAEQKGERMKTQDVVSTTLQTLELSESEQVADLAKALKDGMDRNITVGEATQLTAAAAGSTDAETAAAGARIEEKMQDALMKGKGLGLTADDLFTLIGSQDEVVRNLALKYAGLDLNVISQISENAAKTAEPRTRRAAELLKKTLTGGESTAYERGLSFMQLVEGLKEAETSAGQAEYSAEIAEEMNKKDNQSNPQPEEEQEAQETAAPQMTAYEAVSKALSDATYDAVDAAYGRGVSSVKESELTAAYDALNQGEERQQAEANKYDAGIKREYTGQINDGQEKQLELLDIIGKEINRSIKVVDTLPMEDGKKVNAQYDPETNEYTIALNAVENAYIMMAVHESVHDIRLNAPDVYLQLESMIRKYTGENYDSLISSQRELRQGMTDAYYTEEVTANTVNTILDDPTTLGRFAERFIEDEQEKNAFKKLVDGIRDFLRRIITRLKEGKDYYGIKNISDKLTAIDEIRDKYFEGLEEIRDNNTNHYGEAVRNYLSPDFQNEYDEWCKNKKNNKEFYIGTTSKPLKYVGVKDDKIKWDAGKIRKIQSKHPEISDNVIKQVPQMLENPVLIMESRTVNGRITLLGEVYADDGNPVFTALELQAYSVGDRTELIKIASSYVKHDIQGTINGSRMLWVDPDKKRTRSFFAHNRLQLPSSVSYGLNGRISYNNKSVNTNIRKDSNDDTQRKSLSRTEEIIETDAKNEALLSDPYTDEDISRITRELKFASEMFDKYKNEPTMREAALKLWRDTYNASTPEVWADDGNNARKVIEEAHREFLAKQNNVRGAETSEAMPLTERIAEKYGEKVAQEYDKKLKKSERSFKDNYGIDGEFAEKINAFYGMMNDENMPFAQIEKAGKMLAREMIETSEGYSAIDPEGTNGAREKAAERLYDDMYKAYLKIIGDTVKAGEAANGILSAEGIIAAYDLYPGEISDAIKIARGEDTGHKMPAKYNADGIKVLAEYFKAYPTSTEKFEGEYNISDIKRTARETQSILLDTESIKAKLEGKSETAARLTHQLDEKDAQIYRMRERQRKQAEKKKQTETNRKLRENVKRDLKDVETRLEKPTNKKHIPAGMEGIARELLDVFELDGKERQTNEGRLFRDRVNSLAAEVKAANDTGYISFAKEIDEKVGEIQRRAGDVIYLSDANEGTLRAASELCSMITKGIREADETHSMRTKERVSELAEGAIEHLDGKKDINAVKKLAAGYNFSLMDHAAFFDLFGEKVGTKLRRAFDGALGKYALSVKEMTEYRERVTKDEKVRRMESDKRKVKLSEGEYELTAAQLMELYELYKRNDAQEHLLNGGVYIEKKNNITGEWSKGQHIKLTEADGAKIREALTKDERMIADRLQVYMAYNCAAKGNETSRALYGYDRYQFGGDYWTMRVDDATTRTTDRNKAGAKAGLYQRPGFSKEVNSEAKNPLIIRGAFETFKNHALEMAAYNAFAPVTSDAMKLLNYKNYETGSTLKATMESKLGKQAEAFYTGLIEDINGLAQKEQSTPLISRLYGNAKAAAVAANISVIVQQPTAYMRAAAIIDPKYLIKGMKSPDTGTAKERRERMYKYAPLTYWKSVGGADINTGKSISELVLGNEGAYTKLKNGLMAGAGKADDVTWSKLWNACLWEATDMGYKPQSKKWYEAAADRMNDIIDYTQVMDSPLHRAKIMKAGGMTQLYTQFMSEPVKSINVMRHAISQAANAQGAAKIKPVMRSAAALVVTGVVNSAAKSLVYALRDDDDRDKEGNKRTYWDKWLEKFKENGLDELNFINNFPILKEIWEASEKLIKGEGAYGAASSALYEKGIDELLEFARILQDDEKSGYDKAYAGVKALSTLTGLGVNNIWRDVEALIKTFTPEEEKLKAQFYKDFYGEEDTLKEILDMYMIGNMSVVKKDTPPDTIKTSEGDEITLDSAQKQEYRDAYNVAYSQIADAVRLTDVWNKLSDDKKAAAYQKIKTQAAQEGKYAIVGYPSDDEGNEQRTSVEEYAESCIFAALTKGAKNKEEKIAAIKSALGVNDEGANYYYQVYGEHKEDEEARQKARDDMAASWDADMDERNAKAAGLEVKEYQTHIKNIGSLESTKDAEGQIVSGSLAAKKLNYIAEQVTDDKAAIYLAKQTASSAERSAITAAEQAGALDRDFLKKLAGFAQVSGEKDADGQTIANSKKAAQLEYISSSCTKKQSAALLKSVLTSDRQSAVAELVEKSGMDANVFAGHLAGCMTLTSSEKINDYLYSISGSADLNTRDLIYLATAGTKNEYNAVLERVVNKLPLTQGEKNEYLNRLRK